MEEENLKNVIETLDNAIEALKYLDAENHPIAYGIRLGFLAAKGLIEEEKQKGGIE